MLSSGGPLWVSTQEKELGKETQDRSHQYLVKLRHLSLRRQLQDQARTSPVGHFPSCSQCFSSLHCFDSVSWVSGRASSLQKDLHHLSRFFFGTNGGKNQGGEPANPCSHGK